MTNTACLITRPVVSGRSGWKRERESWRGSFKVGATTHSSFNISYKFLKSVVLTDFLPYIYTY